MTSKNERQTPLSFLVYSYFSYDFSARLVKESVRHSLLYLFGESHEHTMHGSNVQGLTSIIMARLGLCLKATITYLYIHFSY